MKTEQTTAESLPRGSQSQVRKFQSQQTNRPLIELIRRIDDGGIILDPSYQRGSVWGEDRKRNLILSLTMGLPIGNIFLNDRTDGYGDLYVIDGKQRLEAVKDFFDDQFSVPSSWFEEKYLDSDKQDVLYSDFSDTGRRLWANAATVSVSQTNLIDDKGSSAEDKEKELFDLINFGGVPQDETDIAS